MPDQESVTDTPETPPQEDLQASGAVHTSQSNSESGSPQTAGEWRYPADYHVQWLAGKTAEEGAQAGQKMFQSMMDGQPQQPQGAPQQPQYQAPQQGYQAVPQYPQQPPAPQGAPTADDYMTDPVGAAQRQIDAAAGQFAPQISGLAAGNAQVSLELVKQGDQDSFNRWGPEIMSQLQTVNQEFWTVPNIKKIVGMVKADHMDEITTDLVNRRIEQMSNDGLITRAGASPTGTSIGMVDGVDFDMEALPVRYKEQMEKARMTPDVLKEFLQKTECDPRGIPMKQAFDEWMKDATSGDVLLAGDE